MKRLIGATLLLAVVILLSPLWLLWAADDGLVQNGLQQFWICGDARTSEAFMNPLANDIMDAAPGDQIGTWGVEEQGDCDVYQHFSPDLD